MLSPAPDSSPPHALPADPPLPHTHPPPSALPHTPHQYQSLLRDLAPHPPVREDHAHGQHDVVPHLDGDFFFNFFVP